MVNFLLSAIEFFVRLLEVAAVKHESKAINLQAGIEALQLQQHSNFTNATRARNVAAKIGELIS